jgi:hypothetical protein
MKFAYLVMYEMRAIGLNIKKLYKYLIDFYNADVIILCQKCFDDDEDRLKLFNKRVKFAKLYDKPNIIEYFNYNYEKDIDALPLYTRPSISWRHVQNYQQFINMNEMAKVLKENNLINDYDYFISFRTDNDIIFPFPDKEIFEKIPHGVYAFDPEYVRYAGQRDVNFIHKDYIFDVLTSYYDYIKDNSIDKEKLSRIINPYMLLKELIPEVVNDDQYIHEEFKKERSICGKILLLLSLKRKNIKINYIKNINHYFNASGEDDRTTSAIIKYHEEYKIYYKYKYQLQEAVENYIRYFEKNYRWTYKDGNILLA